MRHNWQFHFKNLNQVEKENITNNISLWTPLSPQFSHSVETYIMKTKSPNEMLLNCLTSDWRELCVLLKWLPAVRCSLHPIGQACPDSVSALIWDQIGASSCPPNCITLFHHCSLHHSAREACWKLFIRPLLTSDSRSLCTDPVAPHTQPWAH